MNMSVKEDGTVNVMSGKPATMIRKVAVAQCLREAFTSEFKECMYLKKWC
ncbi:MAG: hypothetical protein ACLR43_02435 [Faecalibacillus faecis]